MDLFVGFKLNVMFRVTNQEAAVCSNCQLVDVASENPIGYNYGGNFVEIIQRVVSYDQFTRKSPQCPWGDRSGEKMNFFLHDSSDLVIWFTALPINFD